MKRKLLFIDYESVSHSLRGIEQFLICKLFSVPMIVYV